MILILNLLCEDITGSYISVVAIDKRKDMYIAWYADFDNVTTICRTRRELDIWIPRMLMTMLSEESGIVPKIRLRDIERWEKEA